MWAAVAQEDFFHGAVRENKNQHLDFLCCGAEEGQSGYRSLSGPTVWQLHASLCGPVSEPRTDAQALAESFVADIWCSQRAGKPPTLPASKRTEGRESLDEGGFGLCLLFSLFSSEWRVHLHPYTATSSCSPTRTLRKLNVLFSLECLLCYSHHKTGRLSSPWLPGIWFCFAGSRPHLLLTTGGLEKYYII